MISSAQMSTNILVLIVYELVLKYQGKKLVSSVQFSTKSQGKKVGFLVYKLVLKFWDKKLFSSVQISTKILAQKSWLLEYKLVLNLRVKNLALQCTNQY